jgi:uncharacterized membrane protein YfcA
MEVIGYACAMLVGIFLGMLGSGGSILTVPIMVYLLHIDPVDATGYSLFVVGLTSAIGCATYLQRKLVDITIAVIFGAPSILSVFLTRKFLMPAIPDPVISLSFLMVSKSLFILTLYGLLMVVVAFRMIFFSDFQSSIPKKDQEVNYLFLVGIGFLAGILSGILGVGGGFIFIPALVILAKIPIRKSVGTSLFIIAFNSLSGFAGEVMVKHEVMDYRFLAFFTLLSIAGIFIGLRLTFKFNQQQLKEIFGWSVLLLGAGILIKEIFLG